MHGIEEDFQRLQDAHLLPYSPDGYEPNRLLRGGIGQVRSDANEYLDELKRRGYDVYFCQLECEHWNHETDVPTNIRYIHFISKVRTAANLGAFNMPLAGQQHWFHDCTLVRVIYVVPAGTINR